ncbi:hypothetical protein KQI76_00370 [Amphibacillus sp. MSJ-3]|uniref:DUF3196 family protein n=1 Tax=Amphibacillus sp. MSJ-3 TaxID=2841505 RepID=UPI001C0EC0A4|nr:DUF3196 family protein [Amphibacillus sp. MSJ-3]MBU5593613.1 hypothetical protein [Amphibacillus sp. MSJ-3]
MNEQDHKLILFPKQRLELEQAAFHAMQEKEFYQALTYFDQLIDYGINDQDIVLGKLTCLIELGKQSEAEEICEELIARKDEDYFSYINVYATLLFQFHKHKDVAQLLEEVLNDKGIPDPLKGQLEKLYEVNQPLVDEQMEQEAKITKHELVDAFESNDSLAQWHLVNHLQNTDIAPYIKLFEQMLISEDVHPVIKTVIVGLLQAKSIDRNFKVKKFGLQIMINPSRFPYMNEHPFREALRKELINYEQENPTFFQLGEKLIDRYFYVLYPLSPAMTELDIVKEAIIAIVQASFEPKSNVSKENYSEDTLAMMNQMIEIEKIYFSIMEE